MPHAKRVAGLAEAEFQGMVSLAKILLDDVDESVDARCVLHRGASHCQQLVVHLPGQSFGYAPLLEKDVKQAAQGP